LYIPKELSYPYKTLKKDKLKEFLALKKTNNLVSKGKRLVYNISTKNI